MTVVTYLSMKEFYQKFRSLLKEEKKKKDFCII